MLEEHTLNQKYNSYIQPMNQDFFGIIDERLSVVDPDWASKNILDFGCNNAHLLLTSRGKIKPSSYTGVDVMPGVLDSARLAYPEATFIHYDRHHPAFNPTGDRTSRPALAVQPDVIIAHGVFTHCDATEIVETVDYFKSILAPGGSIVFSAWETEHLSLYVNVFLKDVLGIDVNPEVMQPFENSLYLIDREFSIADEENFSQNSCTWIETFYSRTYLEQLLPGIKVFHGRRTKHTIFVLTL